MSLGLSPVFTLTTDLIVGAVPPERAGVASGMAETSAEFGGALGIAVLGSVMTALYRHQPRPTCCPQVSGNAATPRRPPRDTLGGALATAASLSGDTGAALRKLAARAVYIDAFRTISWACAALTFVAAFVADAWRCAMCGPARTAPRQPDNCPEAAQANSVGGFPPPAPRLD